MPLSDISHISLNELFKGPGEELQELRAPRGLLLRVGASQLYEGPHEEQLAVGAAHVVEDLPEGVDEVRDLVLAVVFHREAGEEVAEPN